MDVIGHAIDTEQFLVGISDNACHVFEQFVFESGFDEILSSFDGEYDLDGDLGIGICHIIATDIPPRWDATDITPRWGYD
jgi:hypothetical protein